MIIDGKAYAQEICDSLKAEWQKMQVVSPPPCLGVVQVGNNPSSSLYIEKKKKTCESLGFQCLHRHFPATVQQHTLEKELKHLNSNDSVHGIIVQLPLPPHIETQSIVEAIASQKDVDGFSAQNVQRLRTGQEGLFPCTPLGCVTLLKRLPITLQGKRALVIGRSQVVGRPMADMLLRENCTVTIAHSHTQDLPALCRQSDIVIAATGQAEMVKGNWIKKDAVVLDVGINRIIRGGKPTIVGDVDFPAALKHTLAITPVPGGVGPMTVAMLMRNVWKAFNSLKQNQRTQQ